VTSIIEKALDKLEKEDLRLDQPAVPATETKADEQPPRVADATPESRTRQANLLERATEPQQPHAPKESPAAQLESAPIVIARPQLDSSPVAKTGSRELRVDLERLSSMGVITPHTTNTVLAEEYRLIKRPLLDRAMPGLQHVPNGNLIMVTSALPGEGKTFTALNLAMSMAMEMDRTVLLVDADVVRSDVSRVLGIEAVEGLTDYLSEEGVDLGDVLVKTDVPKLTVLPAGRQHKNVTELFASQQMRRLADELSQRYADRIIIFDSAPLLATTGSSVLAATVGQIVMVVEAERTLQRTVKDALKQIERFGTVNLVLNKGRLQSRSQYGYGYGYYGAST